LLRLIRGKPKVAAGAPAPAGAGTVGVAAVSTAAGARATAGRLSGWRWPQVATVSLSVILGLEVIVLAVQLLRPVPALEQPVPAPATGEPVGPPEMPSLARAASRPLFVTSIETRPSSPSRQAPSQSAKQLASRLSLLGIVAGESPQAIIEDSETKRTYFVTAGQTVVEGAVVEEVLDNRVILNLQGEQVEIAL